MTRAKKQHVVPRFCLEYFTDDEGNVWAYDFATDSTRARTASETGKENNFYSPLDKDNGRLDDIEAMLSHLESNAAPLYPELISGASIQGEKREHLSAFLAAQHLRSPTVIEAAADLNGKMFDYIGQLAASDEALLGKTLKDANIKLNQKEVAELREFMLDPSRRVIHSHRHSGLMALAGMPKLAEIFYQMDWTILESTHQHLITSDSPLVKVSDPKTYHPIYGDGGFSNKTATATLPLTPTKALLMQWSDIPQAVVKIDKQYARILNRQRAHWAHRFLYADRQDAGIWKLGKKHQVGQKKERMTINQETAEVEVKRSL